MINKTILMLLNQRFLPDPRVEQEYNELKKAGYRVIVVANTSGKDREDYEIIRVNPYEGISSKYNLTLHINPKLQREIIKELKAIGVVEVHAVHVHDLLWSFLGIQLKKVFDAKLVIDLHENYPAFIEDIGRGPKKRSIKQYVKIGLKTLIYPKNGPVWVVLKEFAHGPNRLRKYELSVLKKCDRFIVVVDEALDRFKKESVYEKGVVVSNTKDPDIWKFEKVKEVEDKLVVTYMGTIQDLRGLDTAILAMQHVDQTKFELNIVGIRSGDRMHQKFRSIVEEYGIKNVNLIEWLTDEQKAFKYINDSHVCIVPHKNTELTQTTIPHKLFMYMATGRPVLVSDVAPLKRIVETSNNGLVFKAEDHKDLAQKMEAMFNNDLLSEYSLNGRRAIEQKFNWEHDKNRLVNMYNELL